MSTRADELVVHRALSTSDRVATVVPDLARQLHDPDAAVVLVFASSIHAPDELASQLASALAPVPVFGCTTAGEIGAGGFHEGSVVAVALSHPTLRVGHGLTTNLSRGPVSGGQRATIEAAAALGLETGELSSRRHVALTLVDGRSGQEESFIAGAAGSVPHIRFVGGSASDHLGVEPATRLFVDGQAHPDAALVLIFETELPFTVIFSEHMVPTDTRVVVTASDPGARLVHELNGQPAAQVYRQIVGTSGPIAPSLAARFPFGYYVGGHAYVRSVMAVEGDSLQFACAVDNGAVLRSMRSGDMLTTTRKALRIAAGDVGGRMGAVIAFNCMGRYLEQRALGTREVMETLLSGYPLIGFNTFGEQVNALHVNHTLTGLAFGVHASHD